MKNYIQRIIAITGLLIFSLPALAADSYNDYAADFYQHESYQVRSPSEVIRYTDGAKGALLKSILDKDRIRAVFPIYFERIHRGENPPEIPRLLHFLAARYDDAFKQAPRIYENEYLDSVEALMESMDISINLSQALKLPPPAAKASATDAIAQKKWMDSVESIAKITRRLNAAVYEGMARELRSRVAKGMFTEPGAKRALAIADRLAP